MVPTRHCTKLLLIVCGTLFCITNLFPADAAEEGSAMAQQLTDKRLTEVRGLRDPQTFTRPETKREWLARARELRTHMLVSCGLWPEPKRTPLLANISGRIERDDYSVEKVYFESYPGFFVTGNLYRPLGKKGRFPGIITPHGHWKNGRIENTERGSIPGRCINFARQGYVAFAYDMVGYNDSLQVTHKFGGPREELWGLSLMGLQLWNSMRAVDFLCSLPDVNKRQIACTGASGGGTQTFMVVPVENRIKVAAPVNMISAQMQGGCLCENVPHLRVDTYNVEIGALTAPRPLLMVSATGDWTANTPREEYPDVRSIYELFDATERVHSVQIDAEHNYNKDSREAVYAWFGQWLLGDTDRERFREQPFEVEERDDLLVFPDKKLPERAITRDALVEQRIAATQRQLSELKPRSHGGLRDFRDVMGKALAHALAVAEPAADDITTTTLREVRADGLTRTQLLIGRKGEGDAVPAILFVRTGSDSEGPGVLVVHAEGKAAVADVGKLQPGPLVVQLLENSQAVLAIDCFLTGESVALDSRAEKIAETPHWSTYNRSDLSNRVQDILTGLAYLDTRPEVSSRRLVGIGDGGLWALLARGLSRNVEATAVDVAQFDNNSDDSFLERLASPGLRRAGDVRTAGALSAPGRLLIHNTGESFNASWIEEVYSAAEARDRLHVRRAEASHERICQWLGGGA
jgi:dienelactone hydrolase